MLGLLGPFSLHPERFIEKQEKRMNKNSPFPDDQKPATSSAYFWDVKVWRRVHTPYTYSLCHESISFAAQPARHHPHSRESRVLLMTKSFFLSDARDTRPESLDQDGSKKFDSHFLRSAISGNLCRGILAQKPPKHKSLPKHSPSNLLQLKHNCLSHHEGIARLGP